MANHIQYRIGSNVLYFFKTLRNEKTGKGAAVSIFSKHQIYDDEPAAKMFAQSKTATNCLSCPLRDGRCYTSKGNMARGLMAQKRAILKRYKKFEDIPEVTLERSLQLPQEIRKLVQGKYFRFGAYGCPTNIPFFWVQAIAGLARSWTGYTHEYRDPKKQAYRDFFMASTHTQKDIDFAESLGWRCFTAVLEGSEPEKQVNCPASFEAGRKTTCDRCKLCQGASKKAKSVWIYKH